MVAYKIDEYIKTSQKGASIDIVHGHYIDVPHASSEQIGELYQKLKQGITF